MSERDRIIGSLIGLAICDALGSTVEFKVPGTFQPIETLSSRIHFTDDTSTALCLADSLLRCNGFSGHDQMATYRRWWKHGYLASGTKPGTPVKDIGNATKAALTSYRPSKSPFVGAESSGGNGSLMRLAPVCLFFHGRLSNMDCIQMCADSSKTTHGNIMAIDSCRLLGAMILGALEGSPKERILSPGFLPRGCPPSYWDEHPLCDLVLGIYGCETRKVRALGSAYRTLECAMWALHNSDSFEEGALKVVNLGNDADTVGAVYGQLAGAIYGIEQIPSQWVSRLPDVDICMDFAVKLADR